MLLLIALVSGCASNPPRPILISDFCQKDKILFFEHDATIDYLAANEAKFLEAYTIHNETHERLCP